MQKTFKKTCIFQINVVILHPIYTEYTCMSFKKVLFEEKQFWAVINLYQGSALL